MAKIASAQRKNVNHRLTASQNEEIEKLAYQFFAQRGYQHGFDKEDWLKAETLVRSRRYS